MWLPLLLLCVVFCVTLPRIFRWFPVRLRWTTMATAFAVSGLVWYLTAFRELLLLLLAFCISQRFIPVGLTGIAMGKSTVSAWLARRGWTIVDADEIGRSTLKPGTAPYDALVDAFGASVVCEGGEPGRPVDRAALGRHCFGHRDRLRTLNRITHPAIGKAILFQVFWSCLVSPHPTVVDAALLPYSWPLRLLCGPVLAVVCSPTVQRERLRAREDLSDEEVDARLASQGPLSDYTSVATRVFWNDGTKDVLAQQLDSWYRSECNAS